MAADVTKNFDEYINDIKKMQNSSDIFVTNMSKYIQILNRAKTVLGKTVDEINESIKNPELEAYYNNIVSLMNDLTISQEKYASSVSNVSKNFKTVDDTDIEKLFKLKNGLEEVSKELDSFYKKIERKANKKGISFDDYINDVNNAKDKAIYDALSADKIKKARDFRQYAQSNQEMLHIATELDKNNGIGRNYRRFSKELKNAKKLNDDINSAIDATNEKTQEVAENQRKVNEELKITKDRWSIISGAVKGAYTYMKDSVKILMKYETVAYSTAKSMGMTASQAESLHNHNLKAIPKLASAFGLAAEEVAKFQENYSKATNRAIRLNETEAKTYAAMVKMVGSETTNTAVEGFDALGGSMEAVGEAMSKLMKDASTQGMNLAKASSEMSKNIKLAQRYNFRDGVDGMNKMTLLSQRLKFNMESIATAADNMNTVESAITASANLQKLGGSFALQYSDPMRVLYESLNDFEGVAERIAKTYEGKAYFDRNEGIVQMSSYNKRMLSESAKILGISYEDAWGMASQQAKYKDMEREFNGNLSKEQKDAISNRATYSKEKGWTVTYYDEKGNEQMKKLSEIDSTIADQIIKGNSTEEAMLDKLSNIEALIMKAQGFRTLEEGFQAVRDMKNAAQANSVNWLKNPLKEFTFGLSEMMREHMNITSAIVAGALMWKGAAIGRRVVKNFGEGWKQSAMTNPQGGFWSKTKGGIKSVFGKSKKIIGGSGSSTAASTTVNQGTKAASKFGKFLSKIPKGGKIGLFAAGATALGALLMSNTSGNEVDRANLDNGSLTPKNVTNNNNIVNNNVTKTNSYNNNTQSSIIENALQKNAETRSRYRTIGSVAGGLLSFVPAVGLIGGAIASGVGATLGHILSPSMSKTLRNERNKARVDSYDYETSKFGNVEVTNENAIPLIAQSSVKSSDTLASIYELLVNNFDKDFRKKLDKNINEKYKDEINKRDTVGFWDFLGFNNGGIVRAENGLSKVPGNSFSGDRVITRVNSGEMILNPQQQSSLFHMVNGANQITNIVKPLNNQYQQATEIVKNFNNNAALTTNSNNSNKINDINLNVNGTITLNSNGQQINLRELLDNPTFKRELSNIILLQMSKNNSGGKINYNDSRTRQNSLISLK